MVRHAPDPVTTYHCEGCDQDFTSARRGPARGPARFCSLYCRDYIAHGGHWACELPTRHPARGYVTPPPNPPTPTATTIPCAWCGTTFRQRRYTARFCSPKCKARQKAADRNARIAGAPGTYSWTDVQRLWLTFDRRCAYCGQPTPLDQVQPDHVIALSRGGANSPTNLLPSCPLCNSDKHELTLDAWAADRARRGKAPLRTAWTSDDPRYRHLLTA